MDEQNDNRIYCPELALSDGEAFNRLVELLFSESNGVNLYAERSELAYETAYFAELTSVIGLVASSEITQDNKMKISFDASEELKQYFISIKSLCANLKDGSLKFAPYIYFTNTEFIKSGKLLVSFFLKSNQIKADPEIAKRAAEIYAQCMPQDPDYIKIKNNYARLPDGRKRYYLNTGIRLVKNLYVYTEKEKANRSRADNIAKIIALNKFLPQKEWINATAYKRLIAELFDGVINSDIDFCLDFAEIHRIQPKIDRCVRKLEFYLRNELGELPQERSYYS